MLEGSQREEQKEKVENAFKNVFKYYKSKKPPPCLNDVLNPHNADHNEHFTRVTSTNEFSSCSAYEVAQRPGLFVLPGFLSESQQLDWAERCLASYSSSSNGSVRNLDAHGIGNGDWWLRSEEEPSLLEKLRLSV